MPRFAALPDIMKKLKGAIILNLGHAVNAIRFASLEILLLTIKQGLEYPVDCIQKVVALLLDPTGDVIVFSLPHRQIRHLALSLCAYINSHFHSVFLPRVVPAMIAAALSTPTLSTVSPFPLCELYSLLSAPCSSKSIQECRTVTDALITEVFRNVETKRPPDA